MNGNRFGQLLLFFYLATITVGSAQKPKFGFLGSEEDVEKLFAESETVVLVCLVETEVVFDTTFAKLKPPFAQIVHHATVVGSHRGSGKVGDKIKVGFVTDSLPVDEEKRKVFVEKANKKAKGALKYAFLRGGKDGFYSCEWLDLADYSVELGQVMAGLAKDERGKKSDR